MINNENNVFNILQVVIRRRWIATWTTMLPKKITNQQGFFLIWWEFEPAQCSYIFHSLSTWWQLSYSQLLWHHTGDGKLIIYVLWNSYLSTCVDLCSYAFDLTKKVPTGWSVSCTSKQRSIQSLMQKWFFQEGRDAAQAKTRPCMARQSVMMICYKVVWLFT